MEPPIDSACILCIEDEQALREELEDELRGFGFEVLTAANSDEAERILERSQPDIVLCDVMMPGRNGFELLADLRQSGKLPPHAAFIFLTGLTDREKRLSGLQRGADGYLTKPIDLDILHMTIQNNLRLIRRATQAAGQMKVHPDIRLSPRERQVLELIGRGQRAAEIAFELSISEHTVNQYTKDLYKKLGVNNRVDAAKHAGAFGLADQPAKAQDGVRSS
ncbi:MAG: DNA-binding response regulator [Pseudooceanicola sp.]|jgi:DNA-binding NarL/FixJ family response regulator|nr:DNA-binding response regulator [Pseudooceanicola sp.]